MPKSLRRYSNVELALRNLGRYIKRAEKVVLNAANGEFAPSAAASGLVPDIGRAELFVRDVPFSDWHYRLLPTSTRLSIGNVSALLVS